MTGIKNIENVLGTEQEDRFYVYALCELLDSKKLRPFYIGKGATDRMWNHEAETDAEYAKLYKKDYGPKKIDEEVTEKQKKIKELDEAGKLERIIIKWGLTENEAFMAESALINLLNYERYSGEGLTNIVNGHASPREKASLIHTTRAMTDKQFQTDCCKETISFEEVRGNVVFINIKNFYSRAFEEKDPQRALRDIVRGCWHIGKDRKPDYIVAVYDSTICGIYHRVKKREMFDLSDYPQYPKDIRKMEKQLLEQKAKTWHEMAKHQKDYKAFLLLLHGIKKYNKNLNDAIRDTKKKDIQDETSYLRHEYETWLKRVYFSCEEVSDDKVILTKSNGDILRAKDLRGRVIMKAKKEKQTSIFDQNPICYPKRK